jgi:hypothetical protein
MCRKKRQMVLSFNENGLLLAQNVTFILFFCVIFYLLLIIW